MRGVEPRQQVGPGLDRFVPIGLTRCDARRQHRDAGAVGRRDEQRHRVPVRLRRVHDAVRVRDPPVVRPDRHEVAEVHDHQLVGHDHVEPHAVASHHLQPADTVVGQHRDGAVVGVRTAAELPGDRSERSFRRVVHEAQVVQRLAERQEELRVEVECHRHDPHGALGGTDRFGAVGAERIDEPVDVGQLVRAVQWRAGQDLGMVDRVLVARVERLLQVAARCVGVERLTRHRDVAAMTRRTADGDGLLGVGARREERPGPVEHAGLGGRRDTVPGDEHEAGVPARHVEQPGHLVGGGRWARTATERREVDDGQRPAHVGSLRRRRSMHFAGPRFRRATRRLHGRPGRSGRHTRHKP